jgi:hypothetical protein
VQGLQRRFEHGAMKHHALMRRNVSLSLEGRGH